MDTPNLDYIRNEVEKLNHLLADPQPGMMSWCMMYGERMQNICDFWTNGKELPRTIKEG